MTAPAPKCAKRGERTAWTCYRAACEREIAALRAEVAAMREHDCHAEELQEELERIYSEVPCKVCRAPITPGCYACDVLREKARADRLEAIIGNAPHAEGCAVFSRQARAYAKSGVGVDPPCDCFKANTPEARDE